MRPHSWCRLVAVALVALLVACVGPPTSRRKDPPRDELAAPAPSPLGVYRGAAEPAAVAEFEGWLGRRVPLVLDFIGRDEWTTIAAPSWWLDRWSVADYEVLYSVPLLPRAGASLDAGAEGAYNTHFRELAELLVARGEHDASLRLGWEFNGGWYPWSARGAAEDYAAYWRNVVRTMRAVRGAAFTFVWNPTAGSQWFPADDAYPGDAYVDAIGVDVYDQSWLPGTYPYPQPCDEACRRGRQRAAWDRLHAGPRGLAFWRDFAASRGKSFGIPEWGLTVRADGHGGGDNPDFVRRMHAFVTDPANQVAYHVYFDYDAPDGHHRLDSGRFPRAAVAFQDLFGASGGTGDGGA